MIPILTAKEVREQEKKIIKETVSQVGISTPALFFGNYTTREDLDEGIKEFENYSFLDD